MGRPGPIVELTYAYCTNPVAPAFTKSTELRRTRFRARVIGKGRAIGNGAGDWRRGTVIGEGAGWLGRGTVMRTFLVGGPSGLDGVHERRNVVGQARLLERDLVCRKRKEKKVSEQMARSMQGLERAKKK